MKKTLRVDWKNKNDVEKARKGRDLGVTQGS